MSHFEFDAKSTCQERAVQFLERFALDAFGTGPNLPHVLPELVGCLEGYAGTGKTFVAAHWVHWLVQTYPALRIVVIAPTNKAVDVLRAKCEALGPLETVDFRTVDSFLGYKVKRNDDWEMERTKVGKTLEYDLCLCDEGSMVKEEMDLELRRKRIPLLYIGDSLQLEPVGEGISTVFKLPRKCTMTTPVRQKGDSPINDVVYFFRQRVLDSGFFLLDDVKQCIPDRSDRRVSFIRKDAMYGWVNQALDKGMDCRIVSFTNAAVNEHNRVMHRMRYPDAPLFGVGQQVLVNEAFEVKLPDGEEELLCNGELLEVLACELAEPIQGVVTYDVHCMRKAGAFEVITDRGTEVHYREYHLKVALNNGQATEVHTALSNDIMLARQRGDVVQAQRLATDRRQLNKLAPLRHADSNTVHKSQGSTYSVCFVDFSDIYKARDMRARLMYVASSRPSDFLVIVS